jgi:hypothetical protein
MQLFGWRVQRVELVPLCTDKFFKANHYYNYYYRRIILVSLRVRWESSSEPVNHLKGFTNTTTSTLCAGINLFNVSSISYYRVKQTQEHAQPIELQYDDPLFYLAHESIRQWIHFRWSVHVIKMIDRCTLTSAVLISVNVEEAKSSKSVESLFWSWHSLQS